MAGRPGIEPGPSLSEINIYMSIYPYTVQCLPEYVGFDTFLKYHLKVKTRSLGDAVRLSIAKRGMTRTDEKQLYHGLCQFSFNPYSITTIPGYDRLLQYGIYSINNKNGMCRDHILSISVGWKNAIDPVIVSHPANCQFLSMKENSSKNATSWITEDQLRKRIVSWN